MPHSHRLVYKLNAQDEIVFVNDEWNRFAADNAGEGILAPDVLHRPLWAFIADPTTRQLYEQVLKRVRSGRPVQFNFRCDSPDHRRLLEMRVSLGADQLVTFATRVLVDETRKPVALLDARAARAPALVRVCGWCNKVAIGDTWAEIEEALPRLRILEQVPLPGLTHGICNPCLERVSGECA